MTGSHYVTMGRLRFKFVQILLSTVALLAIANGLANFETYPKTALKLENRTTVPIDEIKRFMIEDKNPAPGVCVPINVTFCQQHKVPYNYTVLSNYQQQKIQSKLESYGAISTNFYELAALFLCSVFVPKCGTRGRIVRPCRNLCDETKRRCDFFLKRQNLSLPDNAKCENFPEKPNSDECIGYHEVIEVAKKAKSQQKPACFTGFLCDITRCIPFDWKCDGHFDCLDHTDEDSCGNCNSSKSSMSALASFTFGTTIKGLLNETTPSTKGNFSLHCGEGRCISASRVCDGVMDCPRGQDEQYCLKLSHRNGDVGEGRLEVYHAELGKFMPACVAYWESTTSQDVCAILGYTVSNGSKLINNLTTIDQRNSEYHNNKSFNLLKKFQECVTDRESYPMVQLTCDKYACGRKRYVHENTRVKRIAGGVESNPGDWPFLVAVLGGPEEIFFCAGVLITDQWVLTASHCVGYNLETSGYTLQLGITRRFSHSYLGQKLKVKRVIPHPSYNQGVAHDNDIALFQLERRVQYNNHLRPVCLPTADTDLTPYTRCTVIGWGRKYHSFFRSEPTINEVVVPILPRELCKIWLARVNITGVTDRMICAGYEDGGKDSCKGDSGGPLLCQDEKDNGKWFVGGIVSWGYKCALPKLPGIYAYVPKYVTWIQQEILKYSEYNDNNNGKTSATKLSKIFAREHRNKSHGNEG